MGTEKVKKVAPTKKKAPSSEKPKSKRAPTESVERVAAAAPPVKKAKAAADAGGAAQKRKVTPAGAAAGGGAAKKAKAAAGSSSKGAQAPSDMSLEVGGGSKQKPGLVRAQVEKAVVALCTHLSSAAPAKGNELFGDAAQIFVVLSTKQMPKELSGAKAVKPVRLDLPHAWRSLEETDVSLVVKAPQRAIKDKLAAEGVSGVKVIGVDKLKKKYVPFEARRKLRAAYDLMLADDRVIPQLPPLLGSDFFKTNKLPLPINVRKRDLKAEIERCVGSAIMRPTKGTCSSLVVATSAQPQPEIVDNVLAATEQMVQKLKGRWGNVQGVHLRSANSVSLPMYASA